MNLLNFMCTCDAVYFQNLGTNLLIGCCEYGWVKAKNTIRLAELTRMPYFTECMFSSYFLVLFVDILVRSEN